MVHSLWQPMEKNDEKERVNVLCTMENIFLHSGFALATLVFPPQFLFHASISLSI